MDLNLQDKNLKSPSASQFYRHIQSPLWALSKKEMVLQKRKWGKSVSLFMPPNFSMAKKWTIHESLRCGWLAILLCSAADTSPTPIFFLLSSVCKNLKFLQKLILFFVRTLKAPEVFLYFTCLLSAQKLLQNWGGGWCGKSFLSSQIFTGLEKSISIA